MHALIAESAFAGGCGRPSQAHARHLCATTSRATSLAHVFCAVRCVSVHIFGEGALIPCSLAQNRRTFRIELSAAGIVGFLDVSRALSKGGDGSASYKNGTTDESFGPKRKQSALA